MARKSTKKIETIETLSTLARVAHLTRTSKDGFISKSKARQSYGTLTPTVDLLDTVSEDQPTRTDAGIVRRALKWIATLGESANSYEQKLHSILIGEDGKPVAAFPKSQISIAASGVGVYFTREQDEKQRAKFRPGRTGGHLGAIGDKLTVEGTVVDCRYIRRFDKYVVTVAQTYDGSRVTAWLKEDHKLGASVTLKGTVKKHEAPNKWNDNCPTTVVNRPKIEAR